MFRGGAFDTYSAYKFKGTSYDLNDVSTLISYLKAAGWHATSTVSAGTVCGVVGSDGPMGHAIVGVGKGVVAAHNNARWNWPIRNYQVNVCLDPPGAASTEEEAGHPALRGTE